MNECKLHLDGYYHPNSETQLVALIKKAYREELPLRVRGSAHSVEKAIYTHGFQQTTNPTPSIDIMLDRYIQVHFDDKNNTVTAQAGCHLSEAPHDPTKTSTIDNGLLWQMDQRGWMVPDLGGITHQTVSGFLLTGSSGGSVKFSFDNCIEGIRIIDGTGEIRDLKRPSDNDPDHEFWATGVSMGLLGVISEVTFKGIPSFDIKGQEATTKTKDCEVDLFGPGDHNRPSMQQFLEETDYTRMMWWPQKGVEKMTVWKAHRMKPNEYPTLNNGVKPYGEMGTGIWSWIAQHVASIYYSWLGNMTQIGLAGLFNKWLVNLILAPMINLFTPSDPDIITQEKNWKEILDLKAWLDQNNNIKDKEWCRKERKWNRLLTQYKPQQFWQTGWQGLPMDNQMDDKTLPVQFTEIWIPIEKSEEVMKAMLNHYRNGGLKATGTFSCELYASQKSEFWLSPSYGSNVIRVDVFWWAKNNTDPVESFYPQFWNLLAPFGFKLHWGKFLPDSKWRAPGTGKNLPEYLAEQYGDNWNKFLKLREERDPKNLFLTTYWRTHLGIPSTQEKHQETKANGLTGPKLNIATNPEKLQKA